MTAGLGLRLLPQPFEPMPGNPGVMGGVLGIAVAEPLKALASSPITAPPGAVPPGAKPQGASFSAFPGAVLVILQRAWLKSRR